MSLPRIRQLVFACEHISSADDLRHLLDLGTPFPDPGVKVFGLENAVFALGDQFLEIVAPLPDRDPKSVAAGRFLARGGPGGYMAIFQTDDLAAARARTDALGIRRVWDADLDSISASHLHPAAVGAAIVSIDEPRPAGSWTWGGPGWEERSTPGSLTGAVLQAPDPAKLASRWAAALGVEPEGRTLPLEGGQLAFEAGDSERLIGFRLAVPQAEKVLARAREMALPTDGEAVRFQGVTLHLASRT
ncbi:MAG: VOC family protein [Myxococcota bacterium]